MDPVPHRLPIGEDGGWTFETAHRIPQRWEPVCEIVEKRIEGGRGLLRHAF